MWKYKIFYIAILFLCSTLSAQQPLTLWYDKPAEEWTDALPLGNGSLGAMVYGGVKEDHIQFNEATFWSGAPRDYNRKDAYQYLEPIRKLLAEGKQAAAEQLAQDHFMGKRSNEDNYAAQKKEWLSKVRTDTQYAAASFDDSKWKTVQLPTNAGWEKEGWVGLDGSVWFRAAFNVDDNFDNEEFVINLGKIRDVDFTYINGKLVGTGEGSNTIRTYTFNSSILKKGKNVIAVQVLNFYDKGGFADKTIKPDYFTIQSASHKAIQLNHTWKYYIQDNRPPAFPAYNASYLAFADVFFKWNIDNNASGYKRDLELSYALQSVSFTANNIHYRREYFISYPQQAMAMHFTADAKHAVSLSAVFRTYHPNHTIKKINDSTLGIYLQPSDGILKAAAYLSAKIINGKINVTDTSLNIDKADAVTFYLVAATSFRNYHDVSGNPEDSCIKRLSALQHYSYPAIKARHVNNYQKLFNTFSVSFGNIDNTLPADKRLMQPDKANDVSLIALYMQYARYLLISSSRPGGQPANLQGIWNNELAPPWGSKYTTNINLEMNYWPADVLNLSACMQPFISLTKDVSVTGETTAKNYYNINDAWVLHHNTDIWRGTAPVNASNHGIWVSGSGWLATMLWQHFLYTQDTIFLRNEAYPVMKKAAMFYHHFLVKDPATGWLISTPSNSPENGGLVAGPTMDHQIIRQLFNDCIEASKTLNIDKAFSDSLQQQYKQIAPDQIGKYGQLQEWLQDVDDTSNHHRHVSFLWGVYPGHDITWKDSVMMNAAKQSLLYRGDSGTGWSLAWKINLWAKLKDGDHAFKLLNDLLTPAIQNGKENGGTYNNMFDAHPPFQIDGNFGGAAGIAAMLLQSDEDGIELLPALPATLHDGNVKGIRAVGDFELNFSWRDGKLQQVSITSISGLKCTLKYKQYSILFSTEKNKTYRFNNELKAL
ncbi:glycoside hydrolase family 95 protein [Parafilimonas terrae]|uniref:Alpha-L-fucosidase 2 n=1 Tax=Parafilimonas terrae TaxID=1465490 RepID=A0A1I5TN44_9BACT|nr:glycoside hydrolase N-terminal domain-containing protein [Parafilimonas terrae]SFP84514.1 alpha-L-fucosidase 2 [Parafilimonas terrae]